MRILAKGGEKVWSGRCDEDAGMAGKWYNRDMAFIRKFKTASGATGVQVCYKNHGKVVRTVHIGSAQTEKGIEKLLKKAQAKIDEGKVSLFDLSVYDKK